MSSFLRTGCSVITLQFAVLALTPASLEAMNWEKFDRAAGIDPDVSKRVRNSESSHHSSDTLRQMQADKVTVSTITAAHHLNTEEIISLGVQLRGLGVNLNDPTRATSIQTAAQLIMTGVNVNDLTLPGINMLRNRQDVPHALAVVSQSLREKRNLTEAEFLIQTRAKTIYQIAVKRGLDGEKSMDLAQIMSQENLKEDDIKPATQAAVALVHAGIPVDQLNKANILFFLNHNKTPNAAFLIADMVKKGTLLNEENFKHLFRVMRIMHDTKFNENRATALKKGLDDIGIEINPDTVQVAALLMENGLYVSKESMFVALDLLKITQKPTKGHFEAYIFAVKNDNVDGFQEAFDQNRANSAEDFQNFVNEKAEKARLALEKAKQGEIDRIALEKAKQDEIDRLALEKAKQDEIDRIALEKAKQGEKARLALEKAKQDEIDRLALEKAKQDEIDRLALEKAKQDEIDRLALEKAKQDEIDRLALEKAKQGEIDRLALEKAKQDEIDRIALEKEEKAEKARLDLEKHLKEGKILQEKAEKDQLALKKQLEMSEKMVQENAEQAKKDKLDLEKKREEKKILQEKAEQIEKDKLALEKKLKEAKIIQENAEQAKKDKLALQKTLEEEKIIREKAEEERLALKESKENKKDVAKPEKPLSPLKKKTKKRGSPKKG